VNMVDPTGKDCYYFSNIALDIIAWDYIGIGTEVAIIGLFAALVSGPVGAILGAFGLIIALEGTFLLWYSDKYYPNGTTVCF
jgi:hypothetical protein